jgi:NAD(P) transhydrogenase subunit alpha
VVGFVQAHKNLDLVKALAAKKATVLAMELIPRITRAQSMDALSSQATVAGYLAAIHAARLSPASSPC